MSPPPARPPKMKVQTPPVKREINLKQQAQQQQAQQQLQQQQLQQLINNIVSPPPTAATFALLKQGNNVPATAFKQILDDNTYEMSDHEDDSDWSDSGSPKKRYLHGHKTLI